MLHYGVIGSDGNLDKLPEPGLARDLRDAIGEKFGELVQRRNAHIPLGQHPAAGRRLVLPRDATGMLRLPAVATCTAANRNFLRLSAVELHAIGLAFETPDDLRRFYPLVVRALRDPSIGPNDWLRAVRNICRFRNHALHPDAISDTDLYQLTEQLFETLQEQAAHRNFAQIFGNCLETIPFLLKRRRYDPEFLAPTSQLAQKLIHFLEKVDRESRWQLPRRLQPVPRAAINFLQREATESDIEALLGVEDEGDDDDLRKFSNSWPTLLVLRPPLNFAIRCAVEESESRGVSARGAVASAPERRICAAGRNPLAAAQNAVECERRAKLHLPKVSAGSRQNRFHLRAARSASCTPPSHLAPRNPPAAGHFSAACAATTWIACCRMKRRSCAPTWTTRTTPGSPSAMFLGHG